MKFVTIYLPLLDGRNIANLKRTVMYLCTQVHTFVIFVLAVRNVETIPMIINFYGNSTYHLLSFLHNREYDFSALTRHSLVLNYEAQPVLVPMAVQLQPADRSANQTIGRE